MLKLSTTHFGYRTQRNQAGTYLESSFLCASIHSVRRSYVGCLEKKVISNPTQLVNPETTNLLGKNKNAHWCNSDMDVWRLTIYFWEDLMPTPQEGTHEWYYNPGEEPVPEEVTDIRGELTTNVCRKDILLNWLLILTFSPKTSTAHRLSWRSFLQYGWRLTQRLRTGQNANNKWW